MTKTWSERDISSLLTTAFVSGKNNNDDKEATIDVLVTFDRHGISNHPNHRSLYHGAIYFLKTLKSCPPALYTLTTTGIVRKYLGVLDAPITMLADVMARLVFGGSAAAASSGYPQRLLFVSSVQEWLAAQKAMVDGHRSQMVWFRWGWITLGRYMVVNDLKRKM